MNCDDENMRVFIKSFGCSTNLADAEVLAGSLAEAGYDLSNSNATADILIYNTCAVKGPTEDRIIEILKRVPANKKVIVAGCLPLINFERLCREVRFNGIVGPASGDKIVSVLKKVLSGERVVALRDAVNAKPSLDLPKHQLNPVISIIPVNYGCLGSCAYCCVIFARGHLRSYSIEEIVERIKKDWISGVREFWISSQDTACYGRDIGLNLAELLGTVCDIEGDFKVRVGMMNPNWAMRTLNDLIQVFGSEKIFKFIHLPVQSGDNQILDRMHRFYSAEDFKRIVDAFRSSFPNITLATDVICGFPAESSEAFERTLQLIKEVKPDVVNTSKFFARPATEAAKMYEDFVSPSEIKRRSGIVARLAKEMAFEKNRRWIGWTGRVFIDEVGKFSGSWVGRNFAYKPVTVKSTKDVFGKILKVKVVKAFSTHLEAEVIE